MGCPPLRQERREESERGVCGGGARLEAEGDDHAFASIARDDHRYRP